MALPSCKQEHPSLADLSPQGICGMLWGCRRKFADWRSPLGAMSREQSPQGLLWARKVPPHPRHRGCGRAAVCAARAASEAAGQPGFRAVLRVCTVWPTAPFIGHGARDHERVRARGRGWDAALPEGGVVPMGYPLAFAMQLPTRP